MQESGSEYTLVLLPNAFICALSYPRLASILMGGYAVARFNHVNSYTSVRGYNKAMLHEELMRLDLILFIAAAFASSLRITGIFNPMWRVLTPRLSRITSAVKRIVFSNKK